MVNVLHIVVILKVFKEQIHFLDGLLVGKGGIRGRYHLNVRRNKLIALFGKTVAHRGKVAGFGLDLNNAFFHVKI